MITNYIIWGAIIATAWAALLVFEIIWPMFTTIRWKKGWFIGALLFWLFPAVAVLIIPLPYCGYRYHFAQVSDAAIAWLRVGWVPALLYCGLLWFAKPALIRTMAEITTKMKRALTLLAPSVLPIVVAIVYAPINERYLVERFGCGCRQGFNTNHITLSLFAAVFVLSVGMTVILSRNLPGWRSRTLCILLATVVEGFISMRMMAFHIWL